MRNLLLTFTIVLAPGCGGSSAEKPPASPAANPADREMVTRKSEPMTPPPKRVAATPSAPTEEEFDEIERRLAAEAESSEVVSATALDWDDGTRAIVVGHVRYPPEDMPEEEFEEAVDPESLSQCDARFADCIETPDQCDQDRYQTCIRQAFGDDFVYMSTHLGIDCAVFELSVYEAGSFELIQRQAIDPIACEFDHTGEVPAAADLDGDGGPEFVFVWASLPEPTWRETWPNESVAILDANDWHVQYSGRAPIWPSTDDSNGEGAALTRLHIERAEGRHTLVVDQVEIRGYCGDGGYTLGSDFLREPESAGETCSARVMRTSYRYDRTEDVWQPPEPGER